MFTYEDYVFKYTKNRHFLTKSHLPDYYKWLPLQTPQRRVSLITITEMAAFILLYMLAQFHRVSLCPVFPYSNTYVRSTNTPSYSRAR